MGTHPSGDKELNRQHIRKQREGDKELAENKPGPSADEEPRVPGKGRPDAEEGVGTVQNQRR